MAVTFSNGWYDVVPSADTRKIFVSSSLGNDTNDGLSEATPIKTLGKATEFLYNRDGFPDWVCLKKGDKWKNEGFAYGSALSVNGRSPDEPVHFTSYGDGPLPELDLAYEGATGAFSFGGGFGPGRGKNLAFTGIRFYSSFRDPASPNFVNTNPNAAGISLLNPTPFLLVQDCEFQFLTTSLVVQAETPRHGKVIIHRNKFLDGYNQHMSNQCFFQGVDELIFTENYSDRNGANLIIPGSVETYFSHALYVHQTCRPAKVDRNVALRGLGTHDLMNRVGGTVNDNFVEGSTLGISVGGHGEFDTTSRGEAKRNVIVGGRYIIVDGGAHGINGISCAYSVDVEDNIIAGKAMETNPNGSGIALADARNGVQCYDCNVKRNIVRDWGVADDFGIWDGGLNTTKEGNEINLDIYPDPNRRAAQYMASLGLPASLDEFAARCRAQSRDNWDVRFTADAINEFVRTGFGRGTVEPPPPPPPPPKEYKWVAYKSGKSTLYRIFETVNMVQVERCNGLSLAECRWLCGVLGITPP